MHRLLFSFTFLLLLTLGSNSNILCAQGSALQNPIPEWVDNIAFERNADANNGPYNYLLVDKQENTETEARYYHYAIQLNTSEGVQEESSVSVDYDPRYQQLIIHKIAIHRKGKIINKRVEGFQFLQRETDLQRSLYDGRISAVNELGDVRTGDILEYSYTVKGYNPLLSGHYNRELGFEYSIAIDRLYYKILSPIDLQLTYVKGADKASVTKDGDSRIYKWDLRNVKSNFGSSVSPEWQENYKVVRLTSFQNWSEVVDWAAPLYNVSEAEKVNIKKDLKADFVFDGSEEELVEAIRFVQDNIRYLGFEEGVNAYKPHSPKMVLDQRFGDCKDKSLLLSSILNLMDIEASPLLVHSYKGGNIINHPPSPNAFDHCIVQFKYDGSTYQVDPTISSQGGNLEHFTVPNYHYGLAIKGSTEKLTTIKKSIVPLYQVEETIILDSIGGGAIYEVITTCKGSRADAQRDYFNSTSRDNVANSYENFYEDIYPDIAIDTVYVVDSSRASKNIFITHERYSIPSLWEENDAGILEFQIFPLILYNFTDYGETTEKNTNYQLGNPIEYIQNTDLIFPEDWNMQPSSKTINNDYFDYHSSTNYSNQTINFKFRYYLKKEHIEASDIQSTLSDFEELQDDLNFEISYNKSLLDNNGESTNYLNIAVLLLTLIFGAYFCWWIYHNYDPPTSFSMVYDSIGGWLVLPSIGLSITPFILFITYIQLYQEGGYDWNTWAVLWTSNSIENGKLLVGIIIIESILNILQILFSILVVILFFKRRTSAPLLVMGLYVFSFVYPLVDAIIVNAISEESTALLSTDNFKGFITMCIWVPYFHLSQRVKTTFTQTLQDATLTAPVAQ